MRLTLNVFRYIVASVGKLPFEEATEMKAEIMEIKEEGIEQ